MKPLILLLLLSIASLGFAQEFNIEAFSNPEKYDWKTFEEQRDFRSHLFEKQKLLQIYDMQAKKPYRNVLKSAFIPGWGHFSSMFYTKGQILMGIEFTLLASSWFYYDKAMENYDRYKNATSYADMRRYYSDARTPYQLSQTFLAIYALIWGYTLYDTFIVTEEYNQALWNRIEKSYFSKRIIITPTGFQLRF